MACHIRIAAAGISLGLPEIKLGLIPGFGGTQRLARIVGPSHATEMILTGNSVTAEAALRMGLVNRVVPATDLVSAATALAGMIVGARKMFLLTIKVLIFASLLINTFNLILVTKPSDLTAKWPGIAPVNPPAPSCPDYLGYWPMYKCGVGRTS